jgi:hypothetical protein
VQVWGQTQYSTFQRLHDLNSIDDHAIKVMELQLGVNSIHLDEGEYEQIKSPEGMHSTPTQDAFEETNPSATAPRVSGWRR